MTPGAHLTFVLVFITVPSIVVEIFFTVCFELDMNDEDLVKRNTVARPCPSMSNVLPTSSSGERAAGAVGERFASGSGAAGAAITRGAATASSSGERALRETSLAPPLRTPAA